MTKSDQEPDGTACHTYSDRVILTWHHDKYRRTIPLGKINVPVIRSGPAYTNFENHVKCNTTVKIMDIPRAYTAMLPEAELDDTIPMPTMDISTNNTILEDEEPISNKTKPEDELMIWHLRLAHMPFARLIKMAINGDLPKQLSKCKIPKCIACMYGKATKVPWKVKGDTTSHIKPVNIPGGCVSIDQMETTTPGLIAQMKGIPTISRYRYLTVIIDHHSRYTYVHLHTSITSNETLKAKQSFEALAKSLGVKIQHYHADNGRFADKAFLKDVEEKGQTISFCGVRAHFQNGIAERRIRDLQERARTMLIHAQNKWPHAIDASLWPYAIRLTCDIDNNTLRTGMHQSRSEIFSSVQIQPRLKYYHTFGCPAYVLRSTNVAEKGKWEPRAHVGIYLGSSPRHARSVHLILNPLTGLVSPQFHVKFDDLFQTVNQMQVKIMWKEKCHFVAKPLAPKESSVDTTGIRNVDTNENRTTPLTGLEPEAPQPYDSDIDPPGLEYEDESLPVAGSNVSEQGQDFETTSIGNQQHDSLGELPTTHSFSRYGRRLKPTHKATESKLQRDAGVVSYIAETVNEQYDNRIDNPGDSLYSELDRYQDLDDPILYLYKASNDPDTLYMHEALKAHDADKFKEAMVSEVNEHIERKHWEPVLKSDLPENTIILPAVWAMKRKRRIDTRQVYKWKSRLNLGGHKMVKGVHFEETYSPVVAWQNVRLFLILAAINGWHSTQIDFVMAYTQAKITKPTYMELPPGVNLPTLSKEKHCLRILRNIYGGKDSGRVWFQHLRSVLIDGLHYHQSKFDECIFYHQTTIFVVYTDDGILFDPSMSTINERIKDLQSLFDLEVQGNIQDYLGIRIDRKSDGSIHMTQPHLIDSVLEDLNLLAHENRSSTSIRDLPSMPTRKILADTNGPMFTYPWHYRSVIGKLNFLEKSTRPDILYVVHQLARYSTKQRQSHGHAVKHLGRYLLGTRDKGLILHPTDPIDLTCFVDADFCGNWDPKSATDDPETAKSRSGFIVFLAGAPLFWQSKLQTIIALSTAESELIALSEATRFLKSVTYLLDEIQEKGMIPKMKPKVHCQVFEDNAAALEISKVPKIRPRTRHINVLYHHFRSEVANDRVTIKPIKSHENVADVLTKQQPSSLFRYHRQKINGW